MNFFQVLALSVIEGITEFLPISSTGHLILTSNLLKIPQTAFLKSFEIAIQLGAVSSVIILFWNKYIVKTEIWVKVFTAFLPTAIMGAVFYKFIKESLLSNISVVGISLLLGGIFMVGFEKYFKGKKKDNLNLKDYFAIGLFQSISVIPGVSRAMTTIFGGMIMGMNRKRSTEFSFLLAIPTMIGATTLDLIKTDLTSWSKTEIYFLVSGFLTSFIVALIVVKWLVNYVRSQNFVSFGVYRIVLSIIFMGLFPLFYL